MAYYGSAKYGSSTYSSVAQTVTGLNKIYYGNELNDGKESNFLGDQLLVINREMTDAEIIALSTASTEYTWDENTIFLALFNNNLNAGTLSASGVNITSWRLYRKLSTNNQYTLLVEQDNSTTNEYYDFTVASNIYYDYAIEGVADDGRITAKYFSLNNNLEFDGFWLIDQNANTCFQFIYEVPNISINSDTDRTEYKTFSKYPIIKRGQYSVKRGQLQTTINKYDGISDSYIFDQVSLLEAMEGNILLLKFDTGQIYLVDIYDINYTLSSEYEDDEDCEIKVSWVEVGEAI